MEGAGALHTATAAAIWHRLQMNSSPKGHDGKFVAHLKSQVGTLALRGFCCFFTLLYMTEEDASVS